MSCNMNTLIGWYIKAKERIIEDTTTKYACANNHGCRDTDSYCNQCGTKVRKVDEPIISTLDIYDIPDEEGYLEDVFYTPEYISPEGYQIMLSNVGTGYISATPDHTPIVDLTEEVSLQEDLKIAFLKEHEKHIELLEMVYDDVELKFGIIAFYS